MNRLIAPLVAVAALAYLIAMVVTGALPENRQIAKFEAAGVLEQPPESITRIAVASKDGSYVFVRRGPGWASEAGNGALGAEASKALERALTIMHNSKPVRVLTREDIADSDPEEFGLAKPRLSVTLENAGGVALEVHFGASNTDGILQFMSVNGSDRLYLMSDFVGQSWEKMVASLKSS
jgi:hypothetical protein